MSRAITVHMIGREMARVLYNVMGGDSGEICASSRAYVMEEPMTGELVARFAFRDGLVDKPIKQSDLEGSLDDLSEKVIAPAMGAFLVNVPGYIAST